ncbi:uncharacterized protein [Amphiura filiformis]|uniref:uncharacterized protein n=1 Tax=Amphiura filiformis TaxID=82378 RepID=UPI003B21767C
MMFTLFVFGIGSIIWCILKIILNSFDHIDNVYYVYIDNVLNIISLCVQLVFFYDFIHEKLPNLRILHYSISTMIGIKMWSWIGAILEPLWDMDDFEDGNITEGTEDFFEFSEEFFEPFYVEFSTIAVGVLFSIWHSMKRGDEKEHKPQSYRKPVGVDLDNYIPDTDSESDDDADSLVLLRHQSRPMYNKKAIITAATLTGITFTVVSALATIDEVILDLTTRVYIYRGVTVIFFTPLMILSAALLYKLGSLPSVAASFINGNEYVLLFTACSESIYYILRAVAAIGYLTMVKQAALSPSGASNSTTPYPAVVYSSEPNPDHVYNSTYLAVLFLIYSIVKFCEAWLQTRLLIVARRKHVPQYVKNCLAFFVAINLSEWLKSGILLGLGRKHRSNFNPMMDAFYGPSATIAIILLLLPIMILFRFHAAIVAVEIINES